MTQVAGLVTSVAIVHCSSVTLLDARPSAASATMSTRASHEANIVTICDALGTFASSRYLLNLHVSSEPSVRY